MYPSCLYPWCMYEISLVRVPMMHISMMFVSMVHVTMIHVCMVQVGMMDLGMMHLHHFKFCSERTNTQADSRGWIYLWFLILDPDAYMHVSTMHIYMILDPDACVYDAGRNDAYIHDPWPWCMYLWCGAFSLPTDGRTNERTNKAILGVGCYLIPHSIGLPQF